MNMLKAFGLLVIAVAASASPVGREEAETVAISRIYRDGFSGSFSISGCSEILTGDGETLLARVFTLDPTGYVVVSSDDVLPPVVAYSYSDGFSEPDGKLFCLADLVRLDLESRLACAGQVSDESDRALWDEYLSGEPGAILSATLEQWPPAGSTPTGGWLMENWTQSAPYNAYCPMDLIAGARSVAGCPAVAMGMILNHLESTQSTRFTDDDDYYHNYHESYWIDDDHAAHDFPSWPELNVLLDTLDSHYANAVPLTNSDKAAIVFASGSACTQVYTASGSGTFGVGQAYDAYLRFGFAECELLNDTSDSLYEKLSQNMMDALPAHLAIVDAAFQYGHNIVVDGYNTDDFYHFNFGWGGSNNGWFQFPLSGMPYSMNVIEGLVLNISPDPTSVEEETQSGDGTISLSCSMNPAPSAPVIYLGMEAGAHVTLSVYSLAGRLVEVLSDDFLCPGTHVFAWDSAEEPSGLYMIRAVSPGETETLRLTLLN